jgi:hydrogenase maturation protease
VECKELRVTAEARAEILVLGIGNILLRDEGVGVHVVRQLSDKSLVDSVEIVDGGTGGVEFVDIIAGRRKLIVVDAGDIDGEPGDVLRLGFEDLSRRCQEEMSLHEFGLAESLYEAKVLGVLPGEIVIFAVKTKDISLGMEMSEELSAAVPRIIEKVVAEVGRQG